MNITYNGRYNITSPVLSAIGFQDEGFQRVSVFRKSRLDLPGHQAVDYIRINDQYGNATNFIKFDTDYFSTSNCGLGWDFLGKRLKLNAVSILGNSLTNGNAPKYEFTYDQTALPCRNSLARDLFGYFNGASSNNTLIPHNPIYGNGADRNVYPSFTQAGILKSIKYPTKGTSEFFFQPNNSIGQGTATWQNVASFNWTNPVSEPYCDDIVGTSLFVQYFQFTAPTTGTYRLNVTANTSWPSQVQLAALYQGNKTLCDLVWGQGAEILYRQYSSVETDEVFISLVSGQTYRVALANNLNSNASLNLSLSTLQSGSVTYQPAGGLRVYKIIDKSDVTTIAKTRYFYYGDAKSVTPSSLVSLIETGNYVSSGTNQTPSLTEKTGTVEQIHPLGGGYIICQIIERFDSPIFKGSSNNYTYSAVSEIELMGTAEVQLRVSEFYYSVEYSTVPKVYKDLLAGNLKNEKTYKFIRPSQSYELVQETQNNYSLTHLDSTHSRIQGVYFEQEGNYYINRHLDQNPATLEVGLGYSTMKFYGLLPQPCYYPTVPNSWFVYCLEGGPMPKINQYAITGYGKRFLKLDSSVSKEYYGSNLKETTTTYLYNETSNFQIIEVSRQNSLGEIEKEKFVFPDATVHPSLYNQNRVKQLISTQREVGGVVQQEKKISFQTYNTNQILPSKIEENFLASGFTEVVKINSYDTQGNVREVTQVNGVPITIIWGHAGKKMVLKVEGATYAQVLAALGGTITFQGTGGRNFSATQIVNLRSHASMSNALITHYEFDSVYGLTKVEDPNGYKTTFEYDEFGRMARQRDHDGNLIQELRYNIKN